MGFWTSYVGVGYGGVLRPFSTSGAAMLFLAPVVAGGAARPGARARVVRVDAALALRAVLPPADARRPRRHGRRLPGRHAAAARRDVRLLPGRVDPVPAHDVQGGRAAGARAARASAARRSRRCGAGAPAPRRPAVWRAAAVAGAAGSRRSRRGRSSAARAVERQLAFYGPAVLARTLARDLDRRAATTRARSSSPGSCSPTTAGAGRSTPILPALTTHPVATRWIVPFADLRSADLQWAVDGAGRPGAPAARPARAAARPHGRRRPRRRRRRRPLAQRRDCRAGDVARVLGRAGPAGAAYGPTVRRAPDAGTIAPAPRRARGAADPGAAPAGSCACCRARR